MLQVWEIEDGTCKRNVLRTGAKKTKWRSRESSVHTFPERNYLNVDIFSCKWFDPDKAEHEVSKLFGVQRTKSNLIERGIEYLTDDEAEEGMLSERLSLADNE